MLTEIFILTIHADDTIAFVTIVSKYSHILAEVVRVMQDRPIDHIHVDRWNAQKDMAMHHQWSHRDSFKWSERGQG